MEKKYQEFMTCPECNHTDRNLKLLPDEEGFYGHTCSECGYPYKVTFDLTTFINDLMDKKTDLDRINQTASKNHTDIFYEGLTSGGYMLQVFYAHIEYGGKDNSVTLNITKPDYKVESYHIDGSLYELDTPIPVEQTSIDTHIINEIKDDIPESQYIKN